MDQALLKLLATRAKLKACLNQTAVAEKLGGPQPSIRSRGDADTRSGGESSGRSRSAGPWEMLPLPPFKAAPLQKAKAQLRAQSRSARQLRIVHGATTAQLTARAARAVSIHSSSSDSSSLGSCEQVEEPRGRSAEKAPALAAANRPQSFAAPTPQPLAPSPPNPRSRREQRSRSPIPPPYKPMPPCLGIHLKAKWLSLPPRGTPRNVPGLMPKWISPPP